jgi:hypothetical protein
LSLRRCGCIKSVGDENEPSQKYLKKQERTLGILKGKASYQIKNDFKMTDEELLTL